MREKNVGKKIGKCLIAILAAASLMCMTACGSKVPGGPINGGGSGSSNNTVTDNTQDDVTDQDTEEQNTDVADQEEADSLQEETVTEPEEIVTDGFVNVLLSDSGQPFLNHCWIEKEVTYNTKYDYDYNNCLVRSNYDLLHLSEDAAAIYPALATEIDNINYLIESEQESMYQEDCDVAETKTEEEIEYALKYQDGVVGKDNHIYVRRVDGDVLSFMSTTYALESIEIQDRSYKAFNLDVKTGKSLELTDVVNDLDAFYKLLVDKAVDAISFAEFGIDADSIDRDQLLTDIKNALNSGEAAWTLDPNGITFYFNTGVISFPPREVSVIFADDTSGNVFNDKYAEPDAWMVYLEPYYEYRYVSADGKTHTVTTGSYDDEKEEGYWGSEIYLNYDGWSEGFSKETASQEEFALARKGDKYWIYNMYSEFVYPMLDIYALKDGKTEQIQSFSVAPATSDYDYDLLGYYPKAILTDITNVTLSVRTDVLSTCHSSCQFRMDDDGVLSRVDEDMDILEQYRFTITPEYDLAEVFEVSDAGLLTGVTTNVSKGEKLKMIRTNGVDYVDVEKENGEVVRLVLLEDENGQRCITTSEGDKPTWEVFQDMMFAQ